MSDYFQEWRRKLGVVTLVMALLLLSAWAWCQLPDPDPDPLINKRDLPFWWVITPLTLLSTYLLLSKPRTSTQKKVTETIADGK